jgi:hypothetical protein
MQSHQDLAYRAARRAFGQVSPFGGHLAQKLTGLLAGRCRGERQALVGVGYVFIALGDRRTIHRQLLKLVSKTYLDQSSQTGKYLLSKKSCRSSAQPSYQMPPGIRK